MLPNRDMKHHAMAKLRAMIDADNHGVGASLLWYLMHAEAQKFRAISLLHTVFPPQLGGFTSLLKQCHNQGDEILYEALGKAKEQAVEYLEHEPAYELMDHRGIREILKRRNDLEAILTRSPENEPARHELKEIRRHLRQYIIPGPKIRRFSSTSGKAHRCVRQCCLRALDALEKIDYPASVYVKSGFQTQGGFCWIRPAVSVISGLFTQRGVIRRALTRRTPPVAS